MNLKIFYNLFAIFIIVCFISIFVTEDIYNRYWRFEFSYYKLNANALCTFPKLDPYDPSISKYIQHPRYIRCLHPQPYLTYIDYDGYLRFNETEFENYLENKNYSDLRCFYQTFDIGETNTETNFDLERELITPTTLNKDLVEIVCTLRDEQGGARKNYYYDIHAHPAKRINEPFAEPTEKQLSVLFMQIDSMSFSSFKRNMPLTHDFVTKEMEMIMMNNYNKVGLNTVPNTIPMLTGKRYKSEQTDDPEEFKKYAHLSGDSLPMIYDKFKSKGYGIMFNEDNTINSMFTVLNPLKNKHFDYHYSPFWRRVEDDLESRGLSRNFEFCFRNSPYHVKFLDITARHVRQMNESLLFCFNNFVTYSHNSVRDGADIELADGGYRQFWKDNFEKGFFNKTVVLFLSDHGQRFGSIRSTFIGTLEEQNPFVGIWFPKWFYELHPHIKNNLQLNANRLTSSFDIYETLADILNAAYEGQQRPIYSRGKSLLYPVPASRSCKSAGIPRRYCLCIKFNKLDSNSSNLKPLAEFVVSQLNGMLSSYKQCRKIQFKKIIHAESVIYDYDLQSQTKHNGSWKKTLVLIKTQPNNAIFEALVSGNKNQLTIEGTIQRASAYKNTSHCVNDRVLKMYCTCLN